MTIGLVVNQREGVGMEPTRVAVSDVAYGDDESTRKADR